jgi:hypothetical protein
MCRASQRTAPGSRYFVGAMPTFPSLLRDTASRLLSVCIVSLAIICGAQTRAADVPGSGIVPGSPDTPVDDSLAKVREKQKAAFDAFKAGNIAVGQSEASAAALLRPSGPPTSEVGEVEQLLTVAAWLRNENDPAVAAKVAEIAVEKVETARLKLAGPEKAQALLMRAQALDYLIGDRQRGLDAYAEVLAADAKSADARQAMQRLEAQEAEDLRKAAENELARKRVGQTPRKP